MPQSTSPVDLTDYTLAWPRAVFTAVAGGLLADPDMPGPRRGRRDAFDLLVSAAFVHGDHVIRALASGRWRDELPVEEARNARPSDEGALLRALVALAAALPVAVDRAYFSERHTRATATLRAAVVRSQFVQIVEDLYHQGYFDKHMPKGGVAIPAADPNEVLARRLGRDDLWPLTNRDAPGSTGRPSWGPDTLFDLIEVFHDLAARPRIRGGRTGGYEARPELDRRSGQLIYRWRVNDLLSPQRAPLPLGRRWRGHRSAGGRH